MSAVSDASPSWSWGNLPDSETASPSDTPSSTGEHTPSPEEPEEPEESEEIPRAGKAADQSAKPQQHYPSRTCRICLEEVPPSFEPMEEGVTSMFAPAPRVSYISEDPESGRLLRPCKCRGSQAYVHEGCLQSWRHSDASYGNRTYFECPTCKFQYRLERLKWSRWITSTTLQIILTIGILITTIFIFGFIADPIINLYLDPYDTIASTATGGGIPAIQFEDDEGGWLEHFMKGLASLGLLGFVKVFVFSFSPWHWMRFFSGGGGRRQGTGRERAANISWTVVVIGVIMFLYVSLRSRTFMTLANMNREYGLGSELYVL